MKKIVYFCLIVLLVSTCILAFDTDRSDFIKLMSFFFLAFLSYGVILYGRTSINLKIALLTAVLCRIILIFSFPVLSDDIYRFLWDGLLTINGTNPFSVLPDALNDGGSHTYLSQELFNNLNSKSYYTVYPPIAQLIFALGAFLSDGDISLFNYALKVIFLISESLIMYCLYSCLKAFKLDKSRVLYYALNPLIILELMGNLHFESLLLLFFLLAIIFLFQKKNYSSSIMLSFSIMSKMVSLMFLPFVLKRIGLSRWMKYVLICMVLVILGFLPFVYGINIQHFGSSLDLYFRKFEFNASLYYVFRAIGFQVVGYNIIGVLGPVLSILAFISILILSFYKSSADPIRLLTRFSWALLVYLILSTTVHPWYLSLLIVLTPFTNHRFPLIWSFLILLSYSAYRQLPYQESTILLLVEYGFLAAVVISDLNILPNHFDVLYRGKRRDSMSCRPRK